MTPTGARHTEVNFIANREVRIVLKGWRHPKTAEGRYAPLLPEQMPDVTEALKRAWIMAYETTTEGTPISPSFPNTPEGRVALTQHCAEHATTWGGHTTDSEAWAVVLFGQDAAVTRDGTVVA
jgi:hypothetical protein